MVGFPGGAVVKKPPVSAEDERHWVFNPGFERSPGGETATPPVFFRGKFHETEECEWDTVCVSLKELNLLGPKAPPAPLILLTFMQKRDICLCSIV